MDEVPGFGGFRAAFSARLGEWKQYYDLSEPQSAAPPRGWDGLGGKEPSLFQKLVCLRIVRPDKVMTTPVLVEFWRALLEWLLLLRAPVMCQMPYRLSR